MGEGHSDDKSVNAFSWLKYIHEQYLPQNIVAGVMTIFVVLMLFTILKSTKKTGVTKTLSNIMAQPHLFVFVVSMSFLLPILLKVQRLWGFYLHTGFVFLFLAAAMYVEQSKYKKRLTAILVALLALHNWHMWPKAEASYIKLSQRTQDPVFILRNQQYQVSQNYMNEISKTLSQKEVVRIDPYLFYSNNIPSLEIEGIWGVFNEWKKGPLLVVGKTDSEHELTSPLPPPTNAEYKMKVEAHELYKKHVILEAGANCESKPCYELVELEPKLRIYKRVTAP